MAGGDDAWPEELRPFVATLDDLEREVLLLRFGLDRGEPRTLEEVGQVVGLSRDEVRAIERTGMERFKRILGNEF